MGLFFPFKPFWKLRARLCICRCPTSISLHAQNFITFFVPCPRTVAIRISMPLPPQSRTALAVTPFTPSLLSSSGLSGCISPRAVWIGKVFFVFILQECIGVQRYPGVSTPQGEGGGAPAHRCWRPRRCSRLHCRGPPERALGPGCPVPWAMGAWGTSGLGAIVCGPGTVSGMTPGPKAALELLATSACEPPPPPRAGIR